MTGTSEGGRKLNKERDLKTLKKQVLCVLNRLEEKDYQTAIDVSKEVARVE